jgi:membrane protein YdbS with pleckstrin-like domain
MITQGQETKLPASVLRYWLTLQAVCFGLAGLIIFGFFALTGTGGWSSSETGEAIAPEQVAFVRDLVLFGIGGVYILSALLTLWYFRNFSFVADATGLSTTSGIIVTTEKTVQYEEAENASLVRGPILGLFGLAKLRVFTASPAQIIITTTRGGTTTTHKPDVDMSLPESDAMELKAKFATATQRVTVTNQVQ